MRERFTHWKTTSAGLVATALLAYLFNSFHCELPSNWAVWGMTAVPAILGILAKDH